LLEKYLKKLIGKTGIEDALKRLDKLTNEEVRMVAAQVLEATHTVEDKIGHVEDSILEATHTVDDKVGRVEDKVLDVDNKVTRIDDKVAVVFDGA
jgi:hypothetical protein